MRIQRSSRLFYDNVHANDNFPFPGRRRSALTIRLGGAFFTRTETHSLQILAAERR